MNTIPNRGRTVDVRTISQICVCIFDCIDCIYVYNELGSTTYHKIQYKHCIVYISSIMISVTALVVIAVTAGVATFLIISVCGYWFKMHNNHTGFRHDDTLHEHVIV